MAQFIRVHNISGKLIRLNVDHITRYYAEELPDHPGEMGTIIFDGESYYILRETADQIDRLIEPTRA